MGRATRLAGHSSTLYKVFELKSLTIISHTEHYRLPDGRIVGLSSTVAEINHLLSVFDTIIHVAMLYDGPAPQSALPYHSDQIKFMALPAVGGPSLNDKMAILFTAPKVIGTVRRALKEADYFQFRAPTGIGVFVIPYLMMCSSKKGWYKYAGNWKQPHAPFAYRFQKWLLEHQNRPVTINGVWQDQPKQCLSFENPCLTEAEIDAGQEVIAYKKWEFPLELCFVGRLETAKGVDLILEVLRHLKPDDLQKIKVVHLVGEGSRMHIYKNQVAEYHLPVVFHGHLSRTAVHDIYKRSHAIILPSASEGFPKVIAEAMNYGCIPIVSNVSSISHYITDCQNGFLLEALTIDSLYNCLFRLLNMNSISYRRMTNTSKTFMERFSYFYYNQRLLQSVL